MSPRTGVSVSVGPARVLSTSLHVRGSSLGAESILPPFAAVRRLPPVELDDGASPELRERATYGRLASPLPYALQSDYDRADGPVELPALQLSNGVVTATVLPGLGGRVWSLYDHVRERELLHRNPVLRFANFGLTDAWFAGGIEWNLGSTGHSCMSTRPLHAAVLHLPDGDVLRLWEWERTRDLVLQVDLTVAGDRLEASTRVVNPDPETKPLYYWTNIAVPETPGSRVLCPADQGWRTDYSGGLHRVPLPFPDNPGVDISRPLASMCAADYFYDVGAQVGRHLVAVDSDGAGFSQTSTAALTGRKLFLWGKGPGGSRWQEWLSGPDSRYTEIQAGVCPTQLEHARLAGRSALSWRESFGAVDLPPDGVAGQYVEACAVATAAVHSAVDPADLDRRHAQWVRAVADAPPDEMLAVGSGWGFAELVLRGDGDARVSPGLPFPEVGDASAVAVALVRGDEAELDRTAPRLPVPPVSDRWSAVLRDGPAHWWTDYARAVNHHVRGDLAAAGAAYLRSVAARPTASALRGLALVASTEGRVDEAEAHYARARALAPRSRALVSEQLSLLLAAGRPDKCLATLAGLADSVRGHGRTRLLEAQALLACGLVERAGGVIEDLQVDDLAEGEMALAELWAQVHPDRPLPASLDFKMVDEGRER